MTDSVPRSRDDDYTPEMAEKRRGFVGERTGVRLRHVGQFSFEPSVLPGNIENFIGVAQVPIGLAGPLLVHGEHAEGEFYIPLATTEGTLVASYNRGMKLLRAAGGVRTTVHDDCMQRAPAFIFKSARDAREFGIWIEENIDAIREQAESTSSVAKLRNIEQYSASRFRYLRFDYTTGDAAGQNMVTRATRAACDWIKANYPGIDHYYLESNFATDKKSSQVNVLHTRGKRVTAEAIIPGELLTSVTHAPASLVLRGRQVANLGAMLSGANNNGAHSANAITAMFIATGQDVANVAESSAGIIHAELTPEGDYYFSITLPSLIVATHGGGTGLPTQRECLEVLGCYGKGKVLKLAEIVAATVLCGELSLGGAIVADEWVSSHESYGRNR
ncbi:hydroxymethylglutaryl-CoA reductase [Lentisalinibacter orientalis]|jgi:hydroxymethylglutaryl-CoA reductase (NADPH)|uniref:hydroxymethylglutaryl-CoA reductase n=1 Tax=Lentisalinibacter orientalis TaxID=2992241 RepID=UPI0038669776